MDYLHWSVQRVYFGVMFENLFSKYEFSIPAKHLIYSSKQLIFNVQFLYFGNNISTNNFIDSLRKLVRVTVEVAIRIIHCISRINKYVKYIRNYMWNVVSWLHAWFARHITNKHSDYTIGIFVIVEISCLPVLLRTSSTVSMFISVICLYFYWFSPGAYQAMVSSMRKNGIYTVFCN